MDSNKSRTWVEIDFNALTENVNNLKALTPEGCGYIGVVKANAYGHGAVPIARQLESLGVMYLAVACIDEAIELRNAGIRVDILVLGVTPECHIHEIMEYNLTQSVSDLAMAQKLSAYGVQGNKSILIHVKVDTGMSRLGFSTMSDTEIKNVFSLPMLECKGVFTHFANGDCDPEYTQFQLQGFRTLLDKLAENGVQVPIRHCSASGAMLNYPECHMDAVRGGIAMYGYYPDPMVKRTCELKPVMSLKTRVSMVRDLETGTKISYGSTHTLRRASKIAVLPVGYADGFNRLLSNRYHVLIQGEKAPIVGRVCMDMCMVDVTDIAGVEVGMEVLLFGDGLPLDDMAETLGTISYEVLCGITARVPRVYE